MRYRTKNELSTPPNTVYTAHDAPCGSGSVVLTSTSVPKVGRYIEMYDVSQSAYWKRRRTGLFTYNPLKFVDELTEFTGSGGVINASVTPCSPGVYPRYETDSLYLMWALGRTAASPGLTYFGQTLWGTVNLCQDGDISSTEINSAILEACTRVQGKVKTGNTNGWESIAEIRQTLDLLKSPLANVNLLVRNLKRINDRSMHELKVGLKTLDELRKLAQSEWLRFRYGIMPLVNDIKAVLKALDEVHEKVTKSERATIVLKRSSNQNLMTASGGWFWSIDLSSSTQVQVRAVSTDTYDTSVATDLGLSLELLPPTLWELVKLSFVADWFVNVGDYLYAVTPRVGVTHKGGCYTVESSVVRQAICTYDHTDLAGPSVVDSFGTLTQSRRTKIRQPGLLKPSLVVKSDFRFDKTTRLADAAALIGQQLTQISKGLGSILS